MEKLTETDFNEMYEIMKQSFIADELRPFEEQKSLFHEPLYHVFAQRNAKVRNIMGFIALWTFEKFVFIDYFAIHPSYRNQGLGMKMLKEVFAMTKRNICLEIETPEDELTLRRLGFYQRNNFILSQYDYHQPPIARGNAPVSLSLMSSQPITDKEEFEHIRHVIYKYAYERFI